MLRRKLFLHACNLYKAWHAIVEPPRSMAPDIRMLEKSLGLVSHTKKCLGINRRALRQISDIKNALSLIHI